MSSVCPECRRVFEGAVERCPQDHTPLRPLERSDADPMAGLVLDEQYRLESLLGAGGMGKVYRATQLAVERQVAVKVMRADLTDSESAHLRFEQEARTISSLSHPNVVQLIDFGTDETHDILYLVMEFVEGRQLASLTTRGRLDANFALEIVYQVCGGLAEPHQRGMVHRDLKPENVQLLARADGTIQAKVLDFGIVHCVEQTNRLTESGVVCGTPAYLSPEQARGGAVDPRSDLYSLGVMLFEMLTGRLPFVAPRGLQLMLKHVREEPPSISDHVDDAAAARLEPLVRELMAKEPSDRPEDVAAVRRRIEGIRTDLEVPLHRLPGEFESLDALEQWLHVEEDVQGAERSTPGGADFDSYATTIGMYETIAPTAEAGEILDSEELSPLESNEVVEPVLSGATHPLEVGATAPAAGEVEASAPREPDPKGVVQEEGEESAPGREAASAASPEEGRTLPAETAPEVDRSGLSSARGWLSYGSLAAVASAVVLGAAFWALQDDRGRSDAEHSDASGDHASTAPDQRGRSGRDRGSEPAEPGLDAERLQRGEDVRENVEAGVSGRRGDAVDGAEPLDAGRSSDASREIETSDERGGREATSASDRTADEHASGSPSSENTSGGDGPDRQPENSRPEASTRSESGETRPSTGGTKDSDADPEEELQNILESGELRRAK